MKIAAISDTHGRNGWKMPSCNVFIHSGDLTAGGTLPETALLIEAIEKRLQQNDIDYVLITPGNHDKCFHETLDSVKALINDNRIKILIDEEIELDGKKFWASPWTPPFFDWWFMADENKLKAIYGKMPWDLDVLITHGPPNGILDPGWQEPHVGSRSLLAAVQKRNIKHHVFGHLHGAGGRSIINGNTQFHNVAACNEAYVLTNPAKIFEI